MRVQSLEKYDKLTLLDALKIHYFPSFLHLISTRTKWGVNITLLTYIDCGFVENFSVAYLI